MQLSKYVNYALLVGFAVFITVLLNKTTTSSMAQMDISDNARIRGGTLAYYVGCMERSGKFSMTKKATCTTKALEFRDFVFCMYPNHKNITPFR